MDEVGLWPADQNNSMVKRRKGENCAEVNGSILWLCRDYIVAGKGNQGDGVHLHLVERPL